ncbi:hypothetical protein F5883DRAFT_522658 [Diaporthe sp. PMI_573]|nr:hypothetical protein F5883DRAFT_522658 [Diaporthaceae sp. PMI_573]
MSTFNSVLQVTTAIISAAGFSTLACRSLPVFLASRTVLQLLRDTKVRGYLVAAALNIAIAPWTSLVMIPNNFELTRVNNELGGHRSIAGFQAARESKDSLRQRGARDSVDGKGEGVDQFKDTSDPQPQTTRSPSGLEDEKVKAMLTKFGAQNFDVIL